MLDLKFIREHPEVVRKSIRNRNVPVDLDALLELDRERRQTLARVEELKHKKNLASEEIGRLMKGKGKPTPDVEEKIKSMREISEEIDAMEALLKDIEPKIEYLLYRIPNVPHSSVPAGTDASANKVVKSWGEKRPFDFKPLTHIELAEALDLADFPRAAKIAGHGFSLFRGKGARLERALINFMLDLHTKKHGYTEIAPPLLVNRASMTGTGQLPKMEEDMYRLKDDDYFLIPTAEVPVTNIFAGEILDEATLPVYYTACTPCFRREAGAYGKETKGLTRVHQFDKVELVKFVTPASSYEEHEKLLKDAEEVLQLLGLHYRVSVLSTGDLSFAAAKCYDLEAWAPGAGTYLEVSSCSNFEDFQARRANIRYRAHDTRKLGFVHTLNGSGVALARTVICLLETHQNKDGSITLPECLVPYFDGERAIAPD